MATLVELKGVSKVYPRVHRPRERMAAFFSLLAGREPRQGAQVLSDIDLEIRRGQSLGVIGQNGAGKSTLLKILTGVIEPTRGSVKTHAKTAALLELGAGFQPEFSGMENVRMKAALLGLTTAELDQRFDEILAFADIGEYVHEPVKHYSSGMVVRLGFAVVAASRPELLITDEVLAVGDESFQKKCIRWIDDFIAEGGTLMLVSHSMYLVQKLCRHALWLEGGRVQGYGEVHRVTQDYLAWHEARTRAEEQHRQEAAGAHGHYAVHSLELNLSPGERGARQPAGQEETEEAPTLSVGDTLGVDLVLRSPDGRPPVGMIGIARLDGTPVYGLSTEEAIDALKPLEGQDSLFRASLDFPALNLLPGQYVLRGHALDPEGMRMCDTAERHFRVRGETHEFGLVRLAHRWR
ncbi:MAG: ABC transporter ATP-binding protein [Xanthomonadales bacterium]|jgi:lipopolysaccharide transport system ATP-binding protein|nr:ABC transporter ATP-binding protein [Xanthomonadales bacterium]